MLESCVDIPAQSWVVQLVIFGHSAEIVADAVAEQVAEEPGLDLRLTGCNRWTLAPDPSMGAHLCYLADLAGVWASAG